MRVLISGLWAAEQPSGICRTIVNLIRCLNQASDSFQLTLAIGTWQRSYFEDALGLSGLGVETIDISIPNHAIARNRWYAYDLPKLSRFLASDLVHLAYPVPVLKRSFDCPVVMTLHDMYPYDRPGNFGFPRVLFNRLFLRQALRESDRIVCVSHFTLDCLRRHFPEIAKRKALCIHNSVDSLQCHTRPTRMFESPYVLVVAQHRANKNLKLVLESFSRCKQLDLLPTGTRLVVVGSEGPETSSLHRVIERLSLKEDVLLLAGIKDRDLATLYRDCTLFLTLADIEGFDLPLAEALLARARVVASDIPIHREIAGSHCEYVDLGDGNVIESAVVAMQHALRRPPPPPQPLAQLSQDTIASSYVEMYRAVISESAANTDYRSKAQVVPGVH